MNDKSESNLNSQTKYISEYLRSSPLWRIKYRPQTLDSIKIYNPKIYEQLKGYSKVRNIPHLIIVGPEGSGKTLLAELLAKDLLKSEFSINYKLLFADDPIGKSERNESMKQGRISTRRIGSGAGSVRRFRPFIQMRVRPFLTNRKFGDAPFKILTIKNFHMLDVEQQAFRRLMEKYSNNCRMIIITNKISGIIDPIISRCQLIMVPYLPPHLFNKLIKSVCDKEKITIKLDTINYLNKITHFNIGKALDLLQLTYLTYKSLNIESISKMRSKMSSSLVKNLFIQTTKGKFTTIRKTLREIFKQRSLSKAEILLELSRVVMKMPLERELRVLYLELIAQTDFESIESNDDEIQLNKLLSKMMLVGKEI
ncbi:MAG: AAA family ATPase [Promethearchaeota archaeon]